jgi:hypothetical protein
MINQLAAELSSGQRSANDQGDDFINTLVKELPH